MRNKRMASHGIKGVEPGFTLLDESGLHVIRRVRKAWTLLPAACCKKRLGDIFMVHIID